MYDRFFAALAIFGLALGASCHGGPHWQDAPQALDAAQPRLEAAQISATSSAPQAVRVIVVGDSISAGVGASRPGLSYASLLYKNDDRRYPESARRDLLHLYGPALRFYSVAHSGDTTDDVLRQQLPRLLSEPRRDRAALGDGPLHGHTVVVMTIGGNDVRHGLRPGAEVSGDALQHATDNLRQIFAFFADRDRFVDGVSIYFGNVYDVADGTDQAHICVSGLVVPGLGDALLSWDAAYRAVAREEGATLVDLLSLFRGHGFDYANPDNPHYQAQDPTLWVSERDCIHPNNRGHDMLRHAFYEAIAAAMAPR